MTPTITSLSLRGIGIDAVEIARFSLWHTYSDSKLSRIFSADEIAYCRASQVKGAERFAARFAAREALYKALCQAYPDEKWLFLTLCKEVTITHGSHGQPLLSVNWSKIANFTKEKPRTLLSLTHTGALAMAWVVVQSA